MLGIHGFGLFVAAGMLLNLTPGQDTMFIIGQSLTGGLRAGVAASFGIALGTVFHTVAAALGLSAILATSTLAFSIVKILGAAYLIFLGLKLILSRQAGAGVAPLAVPATPRAVFRQGVLTNVLNPKVALFFLAFLPQFVSPTADSRVLSFLFLGGIFIFNGTLWCLALVWGGSAIGRRVRGGHASGLWLKRATGAIFVGLGVRLAVSR